MSIRLVLRAPGGFCKPVVSANTHEAILRMARQKITGRGKKKHKLVFAGTLLPQGELGRLLQNGDEIWYLSDDELRQTSGEWHSTKSLAVARPARGGEADATPQRSSPSHPRAARGGSTAQSSPSSQATSMTSHSRKDAEAASAPKLFVGEGWHISHAIGRQLFTLAAQSGAMPSKTQPRWVTGMRGKKSGKKTGARIFCRNGRAVFCIPSGLADGDTAEVATGIVFATQIATLLQQPEYRNDRSYNAHTRPRHKAQSSASEKRDKARRDEPKRFRCSAGGGPRRAAMPRWGSSAVEGDVTLLRELLRVQQCLAWAFCMRGNRATCPLAGKRCVAFVSDDLVEDVAEWLHQPFGATFRKWLALRETRHEQRTRDRLLKSRDPAAAALARASTGSRAS